MPEQPPTGRTVVLLIDYDNLQICAARDTPGVELDLQAVMNLAQSYGTVLVARAYAEWNHLSERMAAYKAGIEPAFAPVLRTEASGRNGGKSLADTVIVADGVDLLWRMSPDIFVLATSDKDLIPLVRLAKQRGSEVVIVGSDLTAVPLVEMANHFVTYRQLISDREHEKERERLMERERMRVAHEARRDEAMRAREARRATLRAERGAEEERPRPSEERVREAPAAAALPQTPGEAALLAGATSEGAPSRRRRRRRSRSRVPESAPAAEPQEAPELAAAEHEVEAPEAAEEAAVEVAPPEPLPLIPNGVPEETPEAAPAFEPALAEAPPLPEPTGEEVGQPVDAGAGGAQPGEPGEAAPARPAPRRRRPRPRKPAPAG